MIITSILKKRYREETGKSEWALVSKSNGRVLKWFGGKKPSSENVLKEERRVQWFKHKGKDMISKQAIIAKVIEKLSEVKTTYIKPGEEGEAYMPSSEVMMHMKLVGKKMKFKFLPEGKMVQLLNKDGSNFSAPILYSEAGVYHEGGKYFYHPDMNK